MKIHQKFFHESQWTRFENILVRRKSVSGNTFFSDKHLIDRSKDVTDLNSARALNETLNGFFSWIKIEPDRVLLSVDHHRSIPLFYAIRGNEVFISDWTNWVYRQVPETQPDDVMLAEFLVLGYITGTQTLSRDIHQLEPGTIVEISNSNGATGIKTSTVRYFDYIHSYRSGSREQFNRDLDDILVQTMDRAVQYASGRTIALPLSGGYDSRLIALMLNRLDYPDVICYSYGKKNCAEMKIGRQIAEQLGFRWIGITYTAEKWRKWFYRKERSDYYRAASQLAGIPNIQELVAIGELRETGAMPADSVIMGGHMGGALVGGRGQYDSYTYRERPEISTETVLRHIMHYHYSLWDWSGFQTKLEPFFRERILQSLLPIETYPDSPSACEAWNIQQRQSRFIMSVPRLYDFFGFDYWMPFCDQDYMNFWLSVPLRFRHDNNLYTNYIDQLSPFRIATHSPEKRILRIREIIRGTPLFRPTQAMYNRWDRRRKRKKEYRNHPMAWYGIMEKATFDSLYTGQENINSFQSLELLRTLLENGYLSPDEILQRSCEEVAEAYPDING